MVMKMGAVVWLGLILSLNTWADNFKIEDVKIDSSFLENILKIKIPDRYKLNEIIVGNSDAPNEVIVYSSFTCIHCRNFHLTEFPKFKKKYVDTGQAKICFRFFIDDLGALESSALIRCLGKNSNEKIPELACKVFSNQKKWLASKKPQKFLRDMFGKWKYNKNSINQCFVNKEIAAGLMKDHQIAINEYDISLIPAFIVNGKVHQGIISCEELGKLLRGVK